MDWLSSRYAPDMGIMVHLLGDFKSFTGFDLNRCIKYDFEVVKFDNFKDSHFSMKLLYSQGCDEIYRSEYDNLKYIETNCLEYVRISNCECLSSEEKRRFTITRFNVKSSLLKSETFDVDVNSKWMVQFTFDVSKNRTNYKCVDSKCNILVDMDCDISSDIFNEKYVYVRFTTSHKEKVIVKHVNLAEFFNGS